MLKFHNTWDVIFGAGTNTAWSSGFSRSATTDDDFPAKPPEGGTPNDLSSALSISKTPGKYMGPPVFISGEAKHAATSKAESIR
jgi:hypothetical protein